MSLWSDMIYLEIGRNQIEQEQPEIPKEESNGLKTPSNRRDKEHGELSQLTFKVMKGSLMGPRDILYRKSLRKHI